MARSHIVTFRLSEKDFAGLEVIAKEHKTLQGERPPSCNIVARSLVLEALEKLKDEGGAQ